VSDLFLHQAEFLEVYSKYINNYDNALSTLIKCKQENKHFEEFIRRCEARPECNYEDLQSFLIGPIQRMPRYLMMLKDLEKRTSRSDPVYEELSQAVQCMELIINQLNEKKREEEKAMKAHQLIQKFVDRRNVVPKRVKETDNVSVTANPADWKATATNSKSRKNKIVKRNIIKEGKVFVRPRVGALGFVKKERKFILFTDILVEVAISEDGATSPRTDHSSREKIKKNIASKEAKVRGLTRSVAANVGIPHASGDQANKEEREDALYLVKDAEMLDSNCRVVPFPDYFQFQNANKRKFEYACTDSTEKNEWVSAIQHAISDLDNLHKTHTK